ncbi:hypothetical protein DPMN_066783, partial [Dreissena polymorpha]
MAIFLKILTLVIFCNTPYLVGGFNLTSPVANDVMWYLRNVSMYRSLFLSPSNNTCPTRTSLPTPTRPFDTAANDTCSTPSGSSITNGNMNSASKFVEFNSTSDTSCVVVNFTESTTGHFSLTFWIKSNINVSSHLVTIGNVAMNINGDYLAIGSESKPGLKKNEWTLITVTFNDILSLLSVFSSTHAKPVFNQNVSITSRSVSIGPKTALPAGQSLIVGDVRWYPDVLTDRELTLLSNGTFNAFNPNSECRCRPETPFIDNTTVPFPGLRCTNYDKTKSTMRLNSNAPIYVADNDNATYWSSGNTADVSLNIELSQTYQLNQIVVHGLNNTSDIGAIEITIASSGTLLKFEPNCSLPCIDIAGHLTGGQFNYSFDESGTTRTQYEKLLARNLVLRIKSKTPKEFRISEFIVKARCPCYGQGSACVITKGSYSCKCQNYSGSYCSDCADGYFRTSYESLTCETCDCNLSGRENNTCVKIGGKCHCKTNAEGDKCATCKPNSANLGSNSTTGCQSCGCNLAGFVSCNFDLSCKCKPNVENASGKCNACLAGFYNISRPDGCTNCSCNLYGSNNTTCNYATGQCQCYDNVEGQKCDICKNLFYNLSSKCSQSCNCSAAGSVNMVCDKTSGQCSCSSPATQPNRQCIPLISSLTPEFGPSAGGTVVTITGELLDNLNVAPTIFIGEDAQVFINRTSTSIVFVTNKSYNGSRDISIRWSFNEITTKFGAMFEYRPDTNLSVMSNIAAYESGGCHIGFPGTYLDSVKHPRLVVYLDNNNKLESDCSSSGTECSPTGDRVLCCKTPHISSMTTDMTLNFGFKLDGIVNYTNISNFHFVAFKDPVVNRNIETKLSNTFDNGLIEVTGERLNSACNDTDIKITVGEIPCPIESRSDTKITCTINEKFPGKSRTEEIRVTIGNFTQVYGTVEFISFWNTLGFYLILGGVGLLVVIIVVACCCYRRRKSKSGGESGFLDTESYDRKNRSGNEYVRMTPAAPIETAPMSEILSSASGTVPVARSVLAPTTSFLSPTPTSNTAAHKVAFCDRLDKPDAKLIESSVVLREHVELSKNPRCTNKGKLARVIDGQFSDSSSRSTVGRSLTIKVLNERYP